MKKEKVTIVKGGNELENGNFLFNSAETNTLECSKEEEEKSKETRQEEETTEQISLQADSPVPEDPRNAPVIDQQALAFQRSRWRRVLRTALPLQVTIIFQSDQEISKRTFLTTYMFFLTNQAKI
jgi:hypothetical protein